MEAPPLYRILKKSARAIAAGERRYDRLEPTRSPSFAPTAGSTDYVAVRRQADLQPPGPTIGTS